MCWCAVKKLLTHSLTEPLSSDRHLSYDACLEVRGEIIRTVLYCVLKLCTVISTHRWAVLTVLWMGFCHTGTILLCVDLFLFICVYFVCFCFILHSCVTVSVVGWTWCDWNLESFDLWKLVSWYDLYCVWWDVRHAVSLCWVYWL